jgi:hypothetical protein
MLYRNCIVNASTNIYGECKRQFILYVNSCARAVREQLYTVQLPISHTQNCVC